jgi:hypothetical protein
MSLTVKEVIQAARAQFKELLPDLAIVQLTKVEMPAPSPRVFESVESIENIRLEELEREGRNWAVTLSVPNPNYDSAALLEGIRNARNLARIAKVIVIDGEDGQLVALKERAA